MIRSKIKPTAMYMVTLAAALSAFLLYLAIQMAGRLMALPVDEVSTGDVALVVGVATLAITVTATALGGIIAAGMQAMTDPPPPQYPAAQMNAFLSKLFADEGSDEDEG